MNIFDFIPKHLRENQTPDTSCADTLPSSRETTPTQTSSQGQAHPTGRTETETNTTWHEWEQACYSAWFEMEQDIYSVSTQCS